MESLRCGRTLAEVEREHILDTLLCCQGNRTHTASLLHISIRCLRIKLHDYAQAGCPVCGPHTHFDHIESDQVTSPSAPGRGH